MGTRKLSELDIIDLLQDYNSELRKLNYKIQFVKDKIANLEGMLIEDGREQIVRATRGAGRPRKEKTEMPEMSNEIAPQPAEPFVKEKNRKIVKERAPRERKPYKLSDWDNMIMDSIRNAGRPLINTEIFDTLKSLAIEKGLSWDDDKAKAKINQCLIKLANRRDDLKKISYEGRGYAYAVAEWEGERGKLPREIKKTKAPAGRRTSATKTAKFKITRKSNRGSRGE